MNKIGIHFAFWGSDWEVDMCERVKYAAEIGFDVLEVTPPQYMVDFDKPKMDELKKCAEDNGIELSFCIGFPESKDMSSPDPAIRQAGIDFSKKILKAVHYMGGKILTGILYSRWPYLYDEHLSMEYKQECWDRGVKSVQEVIKLAEEYGIVYGIEPVNRFEQFIVNSVGEGVQFCKDVGSDHAKLLVDVFHANIEERNIADSIREAGDLLAHVHLSENNRSLPGLGNHIPWDDVFQALKDIDFKGRIVLEPFIAAGGPVGNDLRIWRNMEEDVSIEAKNKYLKESLDFVRSKLS